MFTCDFALELTTYGGGKMELELKDQRLPMIPVVGLQLTFNKNLKCEVRGAIYDVIHERFRVTLVGESGPKGLLAEDGMRFTEASEEHEEDGEDLDRQIEEMEHDAAMSAGFVPVKRPEPVGADLPW